MKSMFTLFLIVIVPALLSAQGQAEMADTMRSEGKIYVVVAIMLVIFFGLIAYLVMLDRKVSKIEKKAIPHGD